MTERTTIATRGTVFLDRDGVINRPASEGAYIQSWEEFDFLPGAIDGLRRLSDLGYRLIVVTNQRGVARGRMTMSAVENIHAQMQADLGRAGVRLDRVYVCPHEIGTCTCRKPDVGLFEQARTADPGISFAAASVVGDAVTDVEAANRIGARAFLVGPMAERRAAAAGARGLRVDRHAPSLLGLVSSGVFVPVSPARPADPVAR